MYVDLGKRIKESFFYLPDAGDSLRCRNQLAYTTYIINNRGQTQLIPKADIAKVVGGSPDHADALVLANRARKLSGMYGKKSNNARIVAARMLAAQGY
jgi:hypothetical protein